MKEPGFRVHHIRHLNENTFVLRCDRNGLRFEPGQYVNLGVRGSLAAREYSIYSGIDDDFLEVLVRRIEGGLVSGSLQRCKAGDELTVQGPYGMFVTDPARGGSARYLFIGSGTGISPFHCMVRSYPRLDYLLLHGIRTEAECIDEGSFNPARLICCTSRSPGGDYVGRVTDWIRENDVDVSRLSYMCGNGAMINDAFAILRARGVPRDQLFAETYF